MFHVVLYEPEIPPNTGNIIRLCANAGCHLHLVHPLGFNLSQANLKRAGLDYHDLGELTEHRDWPALQQTLAGRRFFTFTTRGQFRHDGVTYQEGDVLVFGPETRGLPQTILDQFDPGRRLRIPMRAGNRSLNLSNAVAIAVYEAWRQQDFR